MRKEKYIFYPNLSPFIEVVPFSFLCFSCLLSSCYYFMSFLCITGFPHSFELFLAHGTPKKGQNLLQLMMHQQHKEIHHRKALSPGNNPKCPKPLVLPTSTHDTEHLLQGPVCRCHFPSSPATRHEDSCLWRGKGQSHSTLTCILCLSSRLDVDFT